MQHDLNKPTNGTAAASAASATDHLHHRQQQHQQQAPPAKLADASSVCENVTFNLNGWMGAPATAIVPRLFAKLDKLREVATAPFPNIGRELNVLNGFISVTPSWRWIERLRVAVDDGQSGSMPLQVTEYDAARIRGDHHGGNEDMDWLLAASLWARVDCPTVQRCVHAPEELRADAIFLLTPEKHTLGQLLDAQRPLPDLDVMCVTRCVAEAVISLWQLDIHVGYELLTPHNIILVEDGPRAGHWQLANQLPALCSAVDSGASGAAATDSRTKPGLLAPSHATFASRCLMQRAGGEPTACAASWCTLLAVLRLAILITIGPYDSSPSSEQYDFDHWMRLVDLSNELMMLKQRVETHCSWRQNPRQPAILTLLEHCDLLEWQAAWEQCIRMPLGDLRSLHATATRLEQEFESPDVGYVRLFSTGVF